MLKCFSKEINNDVKYLTKQVYENTDEINELRGDSGQKGEKGEAGNPGQKG